MVSPSKAKLSRIAGQQQQQQQQEQQEEQQHRPSQASQRKANNKVQLVKGPKPLVYHRFYLDIEQHQIATKIETTIKQLGGSVEFFLNKDVTHFVTDKLQPTAAVGETGEQQREQPPYCASPSGVVSSAENPARPAHQRQPAPLPPLQRTSRQLLHLTHQQQTHGQYVNDYGPATSRTSSPCPPPITSAAAAAAPSSSAGACITTASGAAASAQQKHVVAGPAAVSSSTTAASVGFDGKVKPNHHLSSSLSAASSAAAAAVPRSRADAMLQRVRQQQQQQQQQQQHHHQAQPSYSLLHSSPLNPTAYGSTPTKASTPSSIHTSSHHKQAPSPSGAAITRTSAATTTAASRQNSPVHQARSWGTLIWSAEYALKFLRKVLASLPQAANGAGDSSKAGRLGGDGRTDASGRSHRHHHRHHQSHGARPSGGQHVHHLRGRFVKIESRSAPGNHRPVYQEFKQWPVLLLTDRELAGRKAPFADVHEAPERKQQPVDEQKRKGNVTLEPGGGGGTPVEGTSTSRMTRKLASAANNSVATRTTTTATGKSGETVVKKRAQDKAAAPPRDCGYCEICRIEYDSLAAHVQSDSHQTFVQNDDNFLSLDRLLDSLGAGGDSDETKLAEEDGYDGGEGGGPGGAVAVETFFQQLHSTTRIKRGPGEELLYERRKPPASSAAPQPKAIVGAGGGGTGGDKRQEEKEEEEDGAEGRRNKATTVTVAVTTTTTAAADELIERQQQNTTAPIGEEGEQEARSTQVEATVRQALEEEKPAKIATSKEGDDVNSEETKGQPRAKVKRKRNATTSTSTGADCEEEKCEGKDKYGDKDKKALIRLAIQSVIATFDCSDGFLAEVDQTLDDSVRLDDSVVVGKKEEKEECVKEQVDKSPAVGESGVSDKRAANSSSSRVSVTNRDSSGKKKEEEVLVGQRTSRVRSCKQQPTEAETAEVSVRRSERKLPGSAFREVREEKEKEKVLSKPAEEPEAASGEGMFGRRSAIHHHPHNQLNHHNHQKHKSTLSALLLKQQQERAQQQQQEKEKQQQWDERKATDSAAVLDHAAGMKVITDFRTKQQQQQQEAVEDDGELVAHKSVLLVGVPATEAIAPAATEDARPEETGTPKTGAGRRKRNPQRAEEDATSMGLKASTTASMNKHHHHHHHHLSESGSGGGAGTKTRHATELAATLLECDGLDPKNTKRISLGLRQNPKRANLNEDFTSLLDETLERSKMSGSSTSVRRTAQSRIRVGPKTKEQHTVVVTPKQQQVEEEPSNRVCEDEAKEAHDRLKPVAAAAGSNKRSSASAKKTVTLEDIKVRGIRWRAPSPMTRPPVKSPLLYKVIDNQAGGEETVSSSGGISTSRPTATTTTTATGLQASQRKDPTATGGSAQLPSSAQSRTTCKASKVNGASPGKKNGLIVKIRRVRQSELSLLNDEAENFMFPRKDDSSSDEETDDGRQTSSEGYQGGSANNYSVDITSSSEADRGMATEDATTNEVVMENHSEEDEDDEAAATREEEKRTVTSGGGGRKRKKAIPASGQRACSIESSDHRSSPVSSRSSPTLPIVSKRARLETAARRKAQQTADFGKGQDPVDARVRFPEAPIQPCPVAEAAKTSPSSTDRARRRRQSSASEDGQQHDDDDDANNDDAAQVEEKDEEEEEEHEEEEVKQVVVKSRRGRGAGMRGRRGQRKAYREDSVTSTSSTTAAIGPCPTCSIAKGRGRGRRGGVAGRRGRRGAGRAARGSRLQAGGAASCNCHLLDASRMPPPSSRRRTNESVERAATPASPRKAGTRASKTKTTPPGAVSSSSFTSSYGGDGAAMMAGASHSSYIKGKEDGMGAVFKWINFRKRCEEIEPYRFAFERVPSLEPWYETFQRQDDGTEKVYEYFGSTGYRKLPYEMGPLPALGQNCCILNYKVVPASRKSNRTTSLQSCSSASLEPSSPGGRKSSRPSSSDVQQSFGGAASTADESTESKKCSPSSSLSSLPLKKRKLLLQEGGGGTDGNGSSKTDAGGGSGSSAATAGGEASSNSSRIARLIAGANERPRKSPREHASTLAILSLLQQQQHRKRAGTIKILTSPRKATTATATQTTALHEQLLHQDADSNGEEPSRSCSRASDRASSRAGSSTGGGIKFDRPLFPDSSYVNSRTLCQELDAFLSDELKRVTGSKEGCMTLGAIVKQERSDTGEAEETDERIAIDETADKSEALLEQDDLMMDQELLLPPSVVQEGIAIERNELPVSKRDLLDVLQTVGTEPPLSLKLVQRCESVVKKIVQYDRKERPMVASGTGSGLAISSGSPVIGLQLFDSGSPLAACGPGSGPGSVGGTFLKKRINRTGWPTNKRKIGTRTRQQSRFMLPSSLTGGKKSLSRESIKKEPEEQRGEEKDEEEEDGSLSQQKPQQCAIKAEESLQRHAETEEEDEEEEDNEEQDEGEDNDDEADEEEDEEEEHEDEDDDADTVVEEKIRPARVGGASRKDVTLANHKKTDSVRRKQREDDSKEEARAIHTPPGRRGRKRSVGGKRGVAKRDHINAAATCDDEHDDDDDEQAKEALAATTCEKKPTEKDRSTTVPGPTVDTMPTLRAALMRDNSQLQRLLSSPSSKPPAFSSASPSSILAPGSLNRGTVPFTTTPGRGAAATAGGENVPCPPTPSAPTSGPVLGVNSCKYVTKTTTTMTRVDYDGGGGGGPSPPKRKHSREDVAANNEQEEHHLPKEDARQKQQTGGVTNRHRSSVALAPHDSDDKECDSISSRSIFVSDDCDTTSSSTAINPPDERPPSTSELPSGSNDSATVPSAPSQTNPRLPAIRVRRKESSDNEETIHSAAATEEEEEEEEEHSVNAPLTTTTTHKATKSPRTPSERIRNKMVKNRRAAVRADQTAKGRAGGGDKRPPAKKHHDVQIRAASSSKRRKSSSLGPPLPPPSMMPLSPPLTTSTSSSSSSSYGADDKAPLSPAPAKAHDCESIEEEEEQQHTTTTTTAEQYSSRAKAGEGGEGGVVLTPSKIKTRSSTFGYSPPKRTYGAGKQTPKKLPFVSLIKTNFVQSTAEATAAAEVTLVNGKKAVDGSSTGKGNRRRKAEEKKPRKPSTSPSGRKPSSAGGRKKKDSETVADDAAVAGSDVAGTTDGKRSKKLTLKAKQLLARKRLPKAAKRKEAATSGHFNNNSDGHSNDDGEKEEEDPLLCTLTTTTEEQQQQQQQEEEECLQEVQQKQHHLPEQQFHHQRQRRESSRVHDLLEEHLIEEEEEDAVDHDHELMEVEEEEEEEAQEEDDEVATELEEVDEEEHYELLEVEEVEEEEDGDDGVDGGAEHLHRDEEDTFPAGQAERHHHHHHHNHHHHRQQARREDEKRKLVMADHDYSDQHEDTDPPIVDAEFVEVEELEEEDHLEDDGVEEEAEDEQEEEEEEEDDDDDDDDDGESTITTLTAPPAVGFGKQQQHQPRVKLTFTSSGGTSTVVMTSSGMGTAASTSTSTTTKSTFNSSSPNKYSPRKLRKPRGRWYRER